MSMLLTIATIWILILSSPGQMLLEKPSVLTDLLSPPQGWDQTFQTWIQTSQAWILISGWVLVLLWLLLFVFLVLRRFPKNFPVLHHPYVNFLVRVGEVGNLGRFDGILIGITFLLASVGLFAGITALMILSTVAAVGLSLNMFEQRS